MNDETEQETSERRKKTEAQKRQQAVDAFRRVLASPDGRLVLSSVLAWTCFETENTATGEVAAKIEGARYIGLRLIRTLKEADKEGFLKLYTEMTNG